jgi:predicted PhzF superfamily epimerase YddE/YHI9
MTELLVLRVFVGPDGGGGNPLGVVLDGPAVPVPERQEVAAKLGFSETVFVDEPAGGRVAIYTPAAELPFAGHPLVGTGWLLRRSGFDVAALCPPAGEVPTWQDDELAWITGRAAWAPAMTVRQYAGPAEVEALAGPGPGVDFLYAWAWADEAAGRVRSRAFPAHLGVTEDEATGAAAVRLTALLGRPLDIRQGVGSQILARPGQGPGRQGTVVAADAVSVGGRVVFVEARPL